MGLNKRSGRGSNLHIPNKFHKEKYIYDSDFQQETDNLLDQEKKTKYIEIIAKSMINKVNSPDLFMDYSLNPYQGCEHGCIYCYARPTHHYWGLSSGEDFESNIMIKSNAIEILKKELCSKNYCVKPIMLSGNTDCYQPIERKYKITRSILQLMLDWKHPVMIITKNKLITRDLDILTELSRLNLVKIAISITAATDKVRRIMEPRASSIQSRIQTIETLSENNIPVHAMLAPIIPSINDHEIFDMVRLAAESGAMTSSYQLVRLNGDLETIFSDWLEKNFSEKSTRILNQIKSCHGGSVNNSKFGVRFKGEGPIAQMIRQNFKLAYSKYFKPAETLNLDSTLFKPYRNGFPELF